MLTCIIPLLGGLNVTAIVHTATLLSLLQRQANATANRRPFQTRRFEESVLRPRPNQVDLLDLVCGLFLTWWFAVVVVVVVVVVVLVAVVVQ